MTPAKFKNYWDATYPECVPIPYLLRDAYPSRWVRFHSLPESKRYPENEAEWHTILARHNAVLDSLTEPDEELVFVATTYSESPTPTPNDDGADHLEPNALLWHSIAKHELDNDDMPNYWHLWMSCQPWKPGLFDEQLRLAADWTIANVMIVSPSANWIYHPYDGGADVILRSNDQRDQLKKEFKNWLSARADGL